MSAQDKMIHVANRLGLSSLKDMQGSTRMVYDSITTAALTHTFFKGASQRAFPLTNVGANGNQFQVDEALLVEKIAFFVPSAADGIAYGGLNGVGVKFDLVIGNKTVIKDATVEFGGEQAFWNDGTVGSSVLDLEGVGILIPPQVEYYVVAKGYNTFSREAFSTRLGCYLFGTGALLNFNTTI
ncbi:MAG: hypothetical protein HQL20_11145 [Candidatus Omnitrophica bacterium]|nr:hypothetical protein [Candidatus Omnitrophota bacterium]